MNISSRDVSGTCDTKCAYAFSYGEGTLVLHNHGTMLTLSVEDSSNKVSFNDRAYKVSSAMVVSPSLHRFDDELAAAELIVEHAPDRGGASLYVCVPLVQSYETSAAGVAMSSLVHWAADNASEEGDSFNTHDSSFTLKTFVPRKPYYVYTTPAGQYVVFGVLDGVPMSSADVRLLRQLVSPYAGSTGASSSTKVFYNATGPTAGIALGDGLYISCQPTGSTREETAVMYDRRASAGKDWSGITGGQVAAWVVGVALFGLCLYWLNVLFVKLDGGNVLSVPLSSLFTSTATSTTAT